MKPPFWSHWLKIFAIILFGVVSASAAWAAAPTAAALAGFDSYAAKVEARLAQQHSLPSTFLALGDETRLHQGDPVVEELTPSGGGGLPGALLHDWRGTAFIPGATAADFERVMEDFGAYPRLYAPQVVGARVLGREDDHFQVLMRIRQQHVITVVMDAAYDVRFGRLDALHGYSVSRSTRIDEIASPGTRSEHALSAKDGHGFLWRMNTYWSYVQQDGGLYIQIESISLSRSIPTGLGWVIGPFVESVPSDSLEFTLKKTCEALRK